VTGKENVDNAQRRRNIKMTWDNFGEMSSYSDKLSHSAMNVEEEVRFKVSSDI